MKQITLSHPYCAVIILVTESLTLELTVTCVLADANKLRTTVYTRHQNDKTDQISATLYANIYTAMAQRQALSWTLNTSINRSTDQRNPDFWQNTFYSLKRNPTQLYLNFLKTTMFCWKTSCCESHRAYWRLLCLRTVQTILTTKLLQIGVPDHPQMQPRENPCQFILSACSPVFSLIYTQLDQEGCLCHIWTRSQNGEVSFKKNWLKDYLDNNFFCTKLFFSWPSDFL